MSAAVGGFSACIYRTLNKIKLLAILAALDPDPYYALYYFNYFSSFFCFHNAESKSQRVRADSVSNDKVLSTRNIDLPMSSIVSWRIYCLWMYLYLKTLSPR